MPDADFDRDLRSVAEARQLARTARAAQAKMETLSQEQVDSIVEAMAAAGLRETESLARMAHEETGYGSVHGKVEKNNFVLEQVVAAMRGMKTVGVIAEDRERRVSEIAEPVGVVAGIIPCTNPTSTAMFKCLIALKARCGIVLSPHPAAKACIKAAADVMHEAAVATGAPRGIIGCMTVVSMEGTGELMRGADTDVILATGGMGLVKAAYSAGKPAYGVGPGNVPAYVHSSANVRQAIRDIFAGTTFDNGTLCSSEQSIIHDAAIRDQVLAAIDAERGHVLSDDECRRLAAVLITEKLLVNPELVGKPATTIAAAAGLDVPEGTRVLVCPQTGVGPKHPLSHEKLSPVVALYEVADWREGCERSKELLRFGGLGHTFVIHAQDEEVVLQFGLYKPAHRVLVNTVAAIGAVGATTGLFPSMTLGCGSWGNNITSDNVGPQHLVNVKRLAWGTTRYTAAEAPPLGAPPLEEPPAATALPPLGAPAPTMAATPSPPRAAPTPISGAASAPVAPPAGAGGSASPAGPLSPLPGAASGGQGRPPFVGSTAAHAGQARSGAAPTGAGDPLAGRVSDFLETRGIIPPVRRAAQGHGGAEDCGCEVCETEKSGTTTAPSPPRGNDPGPRSQDLAAADGGANTGAGVAAETRPADFVEEADVRRAVQRGESIHVGPSTIITPLANELGEQHGIFKRR